MKEHTSKRSLSSLAPFLLFVILTACLLSVLLSGADIYQTITERDQANFDQRTLVQYLTTKIHQNDVLNQIAVGDFDSISDCGDTLHIYEEIDGRTVCTRIYCYNGNLYELFSVGGTDFSKSDGQPLLAAQDISFSLSQDFLQIDVEYAKGSADRLYISLRSSAQQ